MRKDLVSFLSIIKCQMTGDNYGATFIKID